MLAAAVHRIPELQRMQQESKLGEQRLPLERFVEAVLPARQTDYECG